MKRVELQVAKGFNPSPDSTELDSVQFVDGDKVRFYNGKFQTVYGCLEASLGSSTMLGCARFLIHFRKDDNNIFDVIGTTEKLYALLGNTLTNITPLVTATTAIANSLATNYATLGTDPIATTNASKTVTATWTSHKLQTGDYVSISGSSDVNGIPAAQINTTQYVQSTPTANTFTFTVATTAATSTGSGGGAAVVVATDLITVTQASHGFATGDRVKIAGAADTGGVLAASINKEHIIRVNSSSTYTVSCGQDYASSSVSSGGGASTTVRGEIADGQCDASYGVGYGMGLYGVGRYGVSKTAYYATNPRVWSGDFFGNYLITCPGSTTSATGTAIYQWDGVTSAAPTVVTNAPTNCQYVFVDSNILVALCDNDVKWSDQGDQTVWTAAATNQAGSQTLYGAGRLISRGFVNGENLLFSSTNAYTMRYIGKPYIWAFDKLDINDGISGIHASGAYGGALFWMGRKDLYMYSGGSIKPLLPSSLREYIFQRIDRTQFAKAHCWVNTQYGEVWFFYQSTDSDEIDSYIAYSINEGCFFYGSWARTASERNYILSYPRLVGADNKIYDHERGNTDNGSALNWFIESAYGQVAAGDDTMEILGMMTDAVQTGSASLTVYTKLSPMSTVERTFGAYTLPATDSGEISKTDFRAHGRMRKYKFSSSATTSFFRMGKIFEYLQLADRR